MTCFRMMPPLAFSACVWGCCSLPQPVSNPTWITPTYAVPGALVCSVFGDRIQSQMSQLKGKLEQGYECCAGDASCKMRLAERGSKAWDTSLVTYSVVHTNVPTADKTDALIANDAAISQFPVCAASGSTKP